MSRSRVEPFAAIFCAAFALTRFTSAQGADFTILRPTDASPTALFGFSVDIAGDYCVVGAPGMHISPEWGVAYVFRRHGTDWLQEAKLTASDPISEDMFGYQIALAGDSVLVGAPGDSIDGEESGSAYVFRRDGRSWLSEARLIASDREDEGFGCAVAMESHYALVGAMRHSNGAQQAGAVYAFQRDGRHWIQEARMTALDFSDDVMLYATAASGFLSGAANTLANFTDEQESESYEIGVKSILMDGTLLLNVAGYYVEYTNLITQIQVAVGNAVRTDTVNEGDVDSTGIDIEVQYRPTDALTLAAVFAFQDATFGVFGQSSG